MSNIFQWQLHGDGKTLAPGEVVEPDERLTWVRTAGIGAQHVIAMFGATFLVPILTGFDPSTTLFFTAMSTALFLLINKNMLPSYLGSSFGFIAPIAAVASAHKGLAVASFGIMVTGILLALIGVVITGILMAWKVKGALFIGILVTTVIGIPMGVTNLSNVSISFEGISIAPTFFKLSFVGLLSKGILPLLTAIVTFAMCDCFDTVGTLIGTAGSAGMLDENGNLPHGDKALIADAVATCTGALMGTSTVTTFVESSTGISEGARTGLSSVVVGILFLLGCVLAPIAGIIPSAATAPALIIVGMFMIGNVAKIDWSDVEVALPCFLTIAMMPFAYSISDGIGFGFISYTLIKMARGKFKEVPVLLYILSALFVVMYILAAL